MKLFRGYQSNVPRVKDSNNKWIIYRWNSFLDNAPMGSTLSKREYMAMALPVSTVNIVAFWS